MGRRVERAVVALTIDLADRLHALGVPSDRAALDQAADIIRPLAVELAAVEAKADRAAALRDRYGKFVGRQLGRLAQQLAEPPQRKFVAFDPGAWVPVRPVCGDEALAYASLAERSLS
jgi:hypothetical protein